MKARKVIEFRVATSGSASLEVLSSLTSQEEEERNRCEGDVRRHIKSYFEAAFALKCLHDKKLYKSEFLSWEDYVSTKLGLDRTYAHRLMKGADYMENVFRPLGDIPLPENESQMRPLTILPPKEAQRAWREVVKKAKHSKITTSLVIQVVAGFRPRHETHKNGTVSSVQKEISQILGEALAAIEAADFETASRCVNKAQVRIEVEAERAKRAPGLEE
jgi:hypothetical protein